MKIIIHDNVESKKVPNTGNLIFTEIEFRSYLDIKHNGCNYSVSINGHTGNLIITKSQGSDDRLSIYPKAANRIEIK